ncbi:DUF1206 domain-containing protein [Brevibacterium paucivorans]|uniref:DUF1206 domain-containing protein n=1 Tax=Brevibacterium paucivorans TaxID=170994 RepID=UPI0031DDB5F2
MSDLTGKAKNVADQAQDVADKAENVAHKAGDAHSETAEKAGEVIQQNPVYRGFVTVGLLAYGVVHLVIAFICVQIAWGGGASGQEASNSGATQQIAQQPFGYVVLIVCAVGLAALVVWQLIEAAIGNQQYSGAKRLRKRIASVGRSAVYAFLCVSAVQAVAGAGGDSEEKQESMVGQVLGMPGGVVIIAVVGVVIAGVGVGQIVSGVKKSFEDDLDGGVAQWVKRLGQVGYITKGVAIIFVGGLFMWSSITHDPEAAGGTNSALRTLVDQPFGPYLLTVMALGIVAFGCFCLVWAFNARHEKAN